MTTSDWHCGDDLVRRYVDGNTDPGLSASIEAHLVNCAVCRATLAEQPSALDLTRVWAGVRETIQRPPLPLPLRVLRQCGLSEPDAVLLSASQSLRGPWVLATTVILIFAMLASWRGDPVGIGLFLLVAPLVPMVGVVGAFAASDPMIELTSTTASSKLRLALLRTFAVTATTVPLIVAMGAVVPGIGLISVAWLAPSLGLTLLALAALTWAPPEVVGSLTALVWGAVIAAAYARDQVTAAVEQDAQLGYLVLAALAAAVLTARIRSARTPGGPA